jgi:hypothetical protein
MNNSALPVPYAFWWMTSRNRANCAPARLNRFPDSRALRRVVTERVLVLVGTREIPVS